MKTKNIILRHFSYELSFSLKMEKEKFISWLEKLTWESIVIKVLYFLTISFFVVGLLMNSFYIFLSSFICGSILCVVRFFCAPVNVIDVTESRDLSWLNECSINERVRFANKNLEDVQVICYIIGMLDIPIDEAIRIVIFVNSKTAARIIFGREDFKEAKLNYKRVISDLLDNSNLK